MEGWSFVFLYYLLLFSFFILSRLFINSGWDWSLKKKGIRLSKKGGTAKQKGGWLQAVAGRYFGYSLEGKLAEGRGVFFSWSCLRKKKRKLEGNKEEAKTELEGSLFQVWFPWFFLFIYYHLFSYLYMILYCFSGIFMSVIWLISVGIKSYLLILPNMITLIHALFFFFFGGGFTLVPVISPINGWYMGYFLWTEYLFSLTNAPCLFHLLKSIEYNMK